MTSQGYYEDVMFMQLEAAQKHLEYLDLAVGKLVCKRCLICKRCLHDFHVWPSPRSFQPSGSTAATSGQVGT